MEVMDLRYSLLLNLKNIPGWYTSRKIVVIECDDWGGIRIPSKEVYGNLKNEGIKVPYGHFRFDTLESADDLEELFNVLDSVKDVYSRSAIMSPATNVANPDFHKIKNFGFKKYYYEKFTDTLIRYERGEKVIDLWKQGINSGLFLPILHGREHIAVQFWLGELQKGNKDLLRAFDNEMVSIEIPGLKEILQGFRPEFYFENENQKTFLETALFEGVALFNDIFGYKPQVFVPADGIFHPYFDSVLEQSGLKFVNVNHLNIIPDRQGLFKYRICMNGQKSKSRLRYYIRNCAFEPSSENYKNIDLTMKQIAAAFKWQKPAFISTHRVNFVGGIVKANREKGLKELQNLLTNIIRVWPDVEFMGSAEALYFMSETNK